MSNPSPNRDLKGELKPRAGVIYDPKVRGADLSFWKALTGSLTIASDKIRVNADTLCSYYQFLFGTFEFAVNVPTTPSSGEAKKWGLLNAGSPTIGSVYFEIAGSTFKAVSYDDEGNVQSTTITWDSWETSETVFQIKWERGQIVFSVGGTVVANHTTRMGTVPLMLYLHNADSDNTDVGYVQVKDTAQLIS